MCLARAPLKATAAAARRKSELVISERCNQSSHFIHKSILFFTIVAAAAASFFVCSPGVIVTNLHERAGMDTAAYAKFLERAKETHPLGRPGNADECAAAIAFLASDAASFSTGVTLPVDGGRHAACPR